MEDKTAIDWPSWGKLKEVKVFEALALLDNTEPGEEPPEQEDTTPTYRKRLRLLLDAMSDRQQFAPGTLNMGNPQLHGVSLIAVGKWAPRNQIPLPAGFPVMPEFIAQARPPCVPPALLELDPGTTIKVVNSIGTYSGIAWCPAGEYKEVLEDVIARQSDGYFTVGEAAQTLKEVRADLDIKTMVSRIYGASIDGRRLVRDAGDRLPLSPDSPQREFADLVLDRDINQWLDEQRAGYRFPDAAPASTPGPAEPAIDTIDFSILATRKQLIEAFGTFTGMDASWFDNLRDVPKLKEARRVTGQGGRGHIEEPYFCPHVVMQWLIDPKRRKGKSLSEEKGWKLRISAHRGRHFSVIVDGISK